jgi:hypothetical protein
MSLPEQQGNPESPQVGDAATFTTYSDSWACTVEEVRRGGSQLVLRRNKAKLLNGANSGEADALTFEPGGFCGHTSGHQRYEYEEDPGGRIVKVSRRKLPSGKVVWKEVGHPTRSPGCVAHLGHRSEHYDFNF